MICPFAGHDDASSFRRANQMSSLPSLFEVQYSVRPLSATCGSSSSASVFTGTLNGLSGVVELAGAGGRNGNSAARAKTGNAFSMAGKLREVGSGGRPSVYDARAV